MNRKGLPVLVVEDDDATREVLRMLLDDEGYEVLEARDGQEGIDVLRVRRGPLVVLVDWWMPRMDGLQMLGAAAQIAHCRRNRYVMLSATYDPRTLERRGLPTVLGVTLLRKPFLIEDVLNVVERQMAIALGGVEPAHGDDDQSAACTLPAS
jgi:CheY-like chemotaxis protein